MSDYPDPFVPKERTLAEWEIWFTDFKLRHGLTPGADSATHRAEVADTAG